SDFLFRTNPGHARLVQEYFLTRNPQDNFSFAKNLELGIYYYHCDQLNKAEKFFKRAIVYSPDSAGFCYGNFYLGLVYFKKKAYSEVVKTFRLIEDYRGLLPKDFLLYYGISFYNLADYDNAISYLISFKDSAQESINYEAGILYLALAGLGKGNYKLSQDILEEELFKNLDYEKTRKYLLGLIYLLQGKREVCKNLLNELVEENSYSVLDPFLELLLGKIYFEERDYQNALKKLTQAYKTNSGLLKEYAMIYLALSYLKLRESAKALAILDSLENSSYREVALYYKARIFEQRTQRAKAQNEYKKLIDLGEISEFTEKAYLNLFQILLDDGNYREFIPLAEKFLTLFPYSFNAANVMYNLVKASYELNLYNKVEIYGEKFITQNQKANRIDEVRFYLAQLKIKENKTKEALRTLSKITERKLYPYAQKLIGDIYLSLDSLDRALEYYVRAERAGSDTIIDIARLAQKQVYYRKGQYPSKIALLEEFIKENPNAYNVARVQYEIAESLYAQNLFAEALSAYKNVLNYPIQSELLLNVLWRQGNCYEQLENFDSAIVSYERLLNYNKNFPYYNLLLRNLAQLYERQGNYEKAIFYYQDLIRREPKTLEHEDGYLALAKIYQKFNRLLEAQTLLKQFIKEFSSSPRLAEAYLILSNITLSLGEYKDAENYIEMFFKKAQKFGDGYFQLGNIYRVQNKYKEAKAAFELASKYYIQEKQTEKSAHALAEAGKCAMHEKRYEEALRYFNQAIQITNDERLRLECERLILELQGIDK
ncbi:MAG: tetratricopeptide repeat protein, partial [candidate division WOR-3 bacterium]|nr:tetratricopeptide repeat protein [candidate division WOR-3 bacterium]